MPEQLTKHPDVTMQVLQSAGAQCGVGAPQTILQTCPAERFCKLPGGEICVYGLADAPRMTQITVDDWRGVAQSLGGMPQTPPAPPERVGVELGVGALLLLVIGGAVGAWLRARFDPARARQR